MDQHSQTDGPVQDRYQYRDLDDDDFDVFDCFHLRKVTMAS